MHIKALEESYRETETAYSYVLDVVFKANLLGSARTTIKSLRGINRHLLLALMSLFCIMASVVFIAASPGVPVAVNSARATHGKLKVYGVGIYENLNCSTVVMDIDWGSLKPGSSRDSTFYVRNEGNHMSTIYKKTGNWNPLNASYYISLSWNYDGRKLSPNEVVKVTLKLQVSSDVKNITDFSFDITIGATDSISNS